MKTIAITGSRGYIATHVINAILQETDWKVIAFTSSVETMENAAPQRVEVVENAKMDEAFARDSEIDYLIHCAFSRRFSTNTQIAESLDFSERIYQIVKRHPRCKLINISSVSVYGVNDYVPDETCPPNPNSLYGMAKYASEVLLHAVFGGEDSRYVNLRLAGIPESQKLPKQLITSAIESKKIELVVPPAESGELRFSWISVADVVEAILCMLKCDSAWKHKVYNITANRENYLLQEVASAIAHILEEKEYGSIEINISEGKPMRIQAGWDSSRIMEEFNWNPMHNLDDMMLECIDVFSKEQKYH